MPIEQFLSPDTIMLIGIVDSFRTLLLFFMTFLMLIVIFERDEIGVAKTSFKLVIAIFFLYLLIPTKGTMIACLVLKTYPPNSWILPEIVAQLLGVL